MAIQPHIWYICLYITLYSLPFAVFTDLKVLTTSFARVMKEKAQFF